jgi:hypothetical protein
MIRPARMERKMLENVARVTKNEKIMTYISKFTKKGHLTST